jgi:hypothetical protein
MKQTVCEILKQFRIEAWNTGREDDELEWLVSLYVTGTPHGEAQTTTLEDQAVDPVKQLLKQSEYLKLDPYFQAAKKIGGSTREAMNLACAIESAVKRLKAPGRMSPEKKQRLRTALLGALSQLEMEEAVKDLGLRPDSMSEI